MKKLAVILTLMVLSTIAGAQNHGISFDCTQWDFGTVSNDDGTVFHTFEITNNSSEDFRIGGLATSCSCVNAYIGRIYIKAGETVKLEISIKAGGYGDKEYYVILYDSDEKKVERITLKINRVD